MKLNAFLFALLSILTLAGCQTDNKKTTEDNKGKEQANTKQETPVKMIEYLVGEWQRDNTAQQQSQTADGNTMDRLTFTEEARYIAYGGDQKSDSGSFRMNEQQRSLYLESETDTKAREYAIDLKENVLTLKARTGEGQDNVSYTFRRVGPPSISEEKMGEQ